MQKAHFQYLILGFIAMITLLSCQKDQLTVTQLDGGQNTDCGNKYLDIDVDYYYNSIPLPLPIVATPVCSCDTLELSFSNVPTGLTFFKWEVYDSFSWLYTETDSTLILENPDTGAYIELFFTDGFSGVFPVAIFLDEAADC